MIKFSCGCQSKLEIPLPIMQDYADAVSDPRDAQKTYLKTFDSISFDTKGS